MPLLDSFQDRVAPEQLRSIRTVQAQLSEPPQIVETVTTLGVRYSDELIDLIRSPFTPPWGIFGVGLWEVNEEPRPTIFMVGSVELTKPALLESLDDELRRRLVAGRLGYVPEGFEVVAFPPADPQLSIHVGSKIECMGSAGTLGLPVWTAGGQRGATTAGHVGSSVGAKVTADAQVLGFVETTQFPAQKTRGAVCADMAVIALHPAVTEIGPTVTAVANAAQYDELTTVEIDAKTGFVRGVSESWANTSTDGAWGDVLISDEAISQPGSSGMLCVNGDNAAVGHVVGGAVPAYSAIQDVNYQLTSLGIHPRT